MCTCVNVYEGGSKEDVYEDGKTVFVLCKDSGSNKISV